MKIEPKFKYVSGSFDTLTNRMLCIPSDNHGTIELCFKEDGCKWNIPFAEILLFDSGTYVDFKSTMPDAKKLGDEICRRWNECVNKQ